MEETLKEIMGDNYKENMTKEEIISSFEQSVITSGKVVPLDKYTNTEKIMKDIKKQHDETRKELENLKNSKLTAEELELQQNTEKDKIIETLRQDNIKNKVEKILISGGLKDEDYKDIIDGFIAKDEETSVKLANSFITTLQKKLDIEVKNKLAEELKKSGKLPDGANNKNNNEAKTFIENLKPNINDDRSKKAMEFYKK